MIIKFQIQLDCASTQLTREPKPSFVIATTSFSKRRLNASK
jgi:hypothetical protein